MKRSLKLTIVLGVKHGLLVSLVWIFLLNLIPAIYDAIWGEKIINDVVSTVIGNETNPNKIALNIYFWEKSNFVSPYTYYQKTPELLRNIGIYKIEGEYRWFLRPTFYPTPVSWILHSKLANCEEYARVFVFIMTHAGVKARIVRAPGEDHAWAEYYYNGIKIVFDPSTVGPIVDPKKFAEGRHWSYVESVDMFNPADRIDVSDEYIKRGKLIVKISKRNTPVKGATVVVYSTYLMKRYPDRYRSPRKVLEQISDENGMATFLLGENEYLLKIKKCYMGFLCLITERKAYVKVDDTSIVDVDFSTARLSNGTIFLMLIGIFGMLIIFWKKRRRKQ
ncbi:transglutaminase-like domain-containing protein [Thermococcus barophilus]|uniref:Transglutaminase-like domain-containing protein n=1 Tax=Thermococcus barophilus (strain DSM 11836 / MP) TaxID=391623 RepID=F0LNA2_THEBM|nr:transglutaminase-like domain-containing protein [Thermococcus barophilus]ADT85241.1 hypothetical protein TERMP_02268 [Thermococcus barophilus MP]